MGLSMPIHRCPIWPTARPISSVANVKAAIKARKEMGWNVPDREWTYFVLPTRINQQALDSARLVFYDEIKPRLKGLSMADAILEVNHWTHEKASYRPSGARVNSGNAAHIAATAGVKDIHASAKTAVASEMKFRRGDVSMGAPSADSIRASRPRRLRVKSARGRPLRHMIQYNTISTQ